MSLRCWLPLFLSRPFSSWRSGGSFEVLPWGDAAELNEEEGGGGGGGILSRIVLSAAERRHRFSLLQETARGGGGGFTQSHAEISQPAGQWMRGEGGGGVRGGGEEGGGVQASQVFADVKS